MEEQLSIKEEIERCLEGLLTAARADDEDAACDNSSGITFLLCKLGFPGDGEWEFTLARLLEMLAMPEVRDSGAASSQVLFLIGYDLSEHLCENDRTTIARVLEENCPLFKDGMSQLVALELIVDMLPDALPLAALERIWRLTTTNARICVPNALNHFVRKTPVRALRERAEKMLEAMCDDADEDMRNEAQHYLEMVRRNNTDQEA